MFKAETAYFRSLQSECFKIVSEKKQLEGAYQGKLRITKKDVSEFDEKYKAVDDGDIVNFAKVIDQVHRQVSQLKTDLDLIQLKKDVGGHHPNDVQIYDEDEEGIIKFEAGDDDEDDPDAALFK